MRTALALGLCVALSGCAAAPDDEEPAMPDDPRKEMNDALSQIRIIARERERELGRAMRLGPNIEAVSDELVRLATPKVVALSDVGATREERRLRAYRIFGDTLREMRDDPQRDPEFRAAVEAFAESFGKQMPAELRKPSPDG